MKTCFKCGIEKQISDFYKHKGMRDGHLNTCKACSSEYSKKHLLIKSKDPKWYLKELERHRIKSRKRIANGGVNKINTPAHKRWIERNPEKRKAHHAVSNAIRDGKLKRELCFCGKKAQAHHEDYSKKLEVIWLCTQHHAEHHIKQRELKYGTSKKI